jgi:hypothetical protein
MSGKVEGRSRGSPSRSLSGVPLKVPPLQLSPAPSASALDFRGISAGGDGCASTRSSDAPTACEASFSCLAARLGAAPPAGVPPLSLQATFTPTGDHGRLQSLSITVCKGTNILAPHQAVVWPPAHLMSCHRYSLLLVTCKVEC